MTNNTITAPNDPAIDYTTLPVHMRGAMQRYIEDRIPPGGFLTSVLCNDLEAAAMKADDVNRTCLWDYVYFLQNYAPRTCHGSPEAVCQWLNGEAES